MTAIFRCHSVKHGVDSLHFARATQGLVVVEVMPCVVVVHTTHHHIGQVLRVIGHTPVSDVHQQLLKHTCILLCAILLLTTK